MAYQTATALLDLSDDDLLEVLSLHSPGSLALIAKFAPNEVDRYFRVRIERYLERRKDTKGFEFHDISTVRSQ